MPEIKAQSSPETVISEINTIITDVEVTEEAALMCYKYPDLECLEPEDCPNVLAKCWLYLIWNR